MDLNDIVRKIVSDKISEIHTCLPAKIKSFDPKTMRADVVLLAKKEINDNAVAIPPIIECPVALMKAGPFVIRQPFEKGDPVLVVFGERAIDKLLITGNPEDPQLKRRHSLDDAIIIGGLQLEQDPNLNSEHTEDLLIENQDTGTKLVIGKEGDIIVESSDDINISATGNVNLQGGDNPIARLGDAIQVEVTSGSSAGVYTGEITEGSDKSFSG